MEIELTVEELQEIADMEAEQAAEAILQAKIAEEAKEEEERLIIEARLEKLTELNQRLNAVSQNNTAYVEAFGHEKHWSLHHKECKKMDCEKTLEMQVVALENALAKVNQDEINKKVQAEATKASLEVKLKALGLTIEEIRSL